VFSVNLTFEKKGKVAEKLSLLATSPLSLGFESLPRRQSQIFEVVFTKEAQIRLFEVASNELD
jgi:hypothetical protein